MWKNKIVVRRNPIPRFPNIASRARYKGVVSSISSCHYKLTPDQKIGWDTYSDFLPTQMSGFNAFMSRNSVLLLSRHPDLKIYFTAPEAYNPPIGPAPIGLCYYPSTGHYCLFWNNPNCVGVYVQGKYSVQTGYSNQKSPSWRMFNTVVSTALHMDFDASKFPVDIMIRFTAMSINMNGETSLMAEAKPPPPMPSSLYVYSPNGSERYYIGSSHWIEWRSINIDTIQIDYSINAGGNWINITPGTSGPAGKYLWTIPDVSSALCLIKISDISEPSNFDTSNANFNIMTAPTINVTAPDGGEEWEFDSKHNITWNHTGCINVKIQFSIDGGDQYQTIIDSTPAADGSYEWTIPNYNSAQCYVKILCVEDLAIYDTSFNPFSISSPFVPESCVAWWNFKTAGYDAGNTRFTDQTGNGHHAANTDGAVGASYTTMNGTSSFFEVDDFLEISADQKKFSVAIWVYGGDQNAGIFCHNYTLGQDQKSAWYIYSFAGENPSFMVSADNSMNVAKWWKTSKTIMDSSPHLIGLTFNNGTFKIYVDGVLDDSPTKIVDDAMTTLNNSTAPFLISERPESGASYSYFNGRLYKAYLCNDEITAEDFLNLFNEGP
jgi:hypothetical protein